MKTKQPGMCGAPWAYRPWNSLALSPTSRRNRLLNDPRLENPTAKHTSVTVRFVAAQQVLRTFDPALRHVLHRCDPVGRPEKPQEVILRQAGHARDLAEAQRLRVVPIGEVASSPQVHEHVARHPYRAPLHASDLGARRHAPISTHLESWRLVRTCSGADTQPSAHRTTPHLDGMCGGGCQKLVGLRGIDTDHHSALTARRDCHVAADQERETTEHLLLGDAGLAPK